MRSGLNSTSGALNRAGPIWIQQNMHVCVYYLEYFCFIKYFYLIKYLIKYKKYGINHRKIELKSIKLLHYL